MMIFAFSLLLLSMFLLLLKIITFKDKYNKILAANSFATNVVVFIVFLAVMVGDATAIDVALVYAFINVVSMIGISKFFLMRKR